MTIIREEFFVSSRAVRFLKAPHSKRDPSLSFGVSRKPRSPTANNRVHVCLHLATHFMTDFFDCGDTRILSRVLAAQQVKMNSRQALNVAFCASRKREKCTC